MDNQHIKNLVVNLPNEENLGCIDLVLEAGAANGSYQIGCLLYLKESSINTIPIYTTIIFHSLIKNNKIPISTKKN